MLPPAVLSHSRGQLGCSPLTGEVSLALKLASAELESCLLQETRYSLFFLTGLARLAGRWRALLPDSLPQLR